MFLQSRPHFGIAYHACQWGTAKVSSDPTIIHSVYLGQRFEHSLHNRQQLTIIIVLEQHLRSLCSYRPATVPTYSTRSAIEKTATLSRQAFQCATLTAKSHPKPQRTPLHVHPLKSLTCKRCNTARAKRTFGSSNRLHKNHLYFNILQLGQRPL